MPTATLTPHVAFDELERVRSRTLDIVDAASDAHLRRQWSKIVSPMVWDLAHVGNYEDLWLVDALAGERVTPPGLDELYDAFRQPRMGREALPLLGPDEARTYITHVRERALRALDDGLLDPRRASQARLVRDAFVVGLVVQHEHQHAETLLQTRQAMGTACPPLHATTTATVEEVANKSPATSPAAGTSPTPTPNSWLRHPGGHVAIGTSSEPWAYDNERPEHLVDLAPFRIARDTVTNGEWMQFIDDGGYDDPSCWHPDGWAWKLREGATAPQYWAPDGAGGWQLLRFGTWASVPAAAPVQHVSWWEADAFARRAGARLPTEQEWEAAARWPDGTSNRADATCCNIGGRLDGPVPTRPGTIRPVTTHPGEPDAAGDLSPCRAMLGNVWEWTSSTLAPWPGFEVFPYAEYSQSFFGRGYRVLRGGSWATDQLACRPTFRNWDLPQRRQLFAGLRLAADA